ncbi:hypothetical protein HanHA300_Chr16g0618311 [Helianthus annuus]|nr:hypothetical protein HanHA300_Chr16g0618311 [Helianthus annuus]
MGHMSCSEGSSCFFPAHYARALLRVTSGAPNIYYRNLFLISIICASLGFFKRLLTDPNLKLSIFPHSLRGKVQDFPTCCYSTINSFQTPHPSFSHDGSGNSTRQCDFIPQTLILRG